MNPPTTLRESAVLIPVFRNAAGEATLVLVRRGSHGVHGGQLAFPGGKREPTDASLLATALRETEEEIGLPATAIEVLAALPPVQTRTSGFHIAACVALLTARNCRSAGSAPALPRRPGQRWPGTLALSRRAYARADFLLARGSAPLVGGQLPHAAAAAATPAGRGVGAIKT
jgi:8-oxo-dGTP pyrophosphatase MutT (NUDIX family)